LDYHLWDAIYVVLMEMLHLIYALDGIKLELSFHLQEIIIKMQLSLKNLIDLLIILVRILK
jgi:hypothetical protein